MLRTERDVVETLAGRTVTLDELYSACEAAGVDVRDDGRDVIHGVTDLRFKRRVRNVLQSLKSTGRARRVGDAAWIIDGTRKVPGRGLLVIAGDVSEVSLALMDAAGLLAETDEPYDLIVADPPWACERQVGDMATGSERVYARDSSKVVGGYADVPAGEYREFTEQWVSAAAQVLRPGAHLAIFTGPPQAAAVQVEAEAAGLEFVNQLIIPRRFALLTSRRWSHAHTVCTVVCAGPATSAARFFAAPADAPPARSGRPYPLDVWSDLQPAEQRRGLVRYDNSLSLDVVTRLVVALTRGPEHGHDPWTDLVADPFVGSGTTAIVCARAQRRFRGGDVNAEALRFTMARMAAEHDLGASAPGNVPAPGGRSRPTDVRTGTR